jgi:hypothetical protein
MYKETAEDPTETTQKFTRESIRVFPEWDTNALQKW